MRARVLLFIVVGCTPPPEPAAPAVTTEPVPPAAALADPEAAPTATPAPTPEAPTPEATRPGASPAAEPEPSPATPPERKPSAAEVKTCAARGGKIEPVCMLGELACVVRYRDAGKRCSDKSECAGECLYEGDDAPQVNAVGRCQRTSDPCGCKAPVVHGRVQPALCAD